jgi:membrane-bound lytic murein transglycosylase A
LHKSLSRVRSAFAVMGAILLQACTTPATRTTPVLPSLHYVPVDWSQLAGWQDDDLVAAWPAFLGSCDAPKPRAEWQALCAEARAMDVNASSVRRFFESRTRAFQVTVTTGRKRSGVSSGLITGYYEPELRGSRQREGRYQTPLYGVPDDLVSIELGDLYPALQGERIRGRLQGKRVVPFADRAQMSDQASFKAKPLLWVDSAIDAFFLQIQGSGRVRLPDRSVVRLAYADVNGHPYRAIGRYLVEKGELALEQATGPGIRKWLMTHADRQQEVFNNNPSVVFFREEEIRDASAGPRGAQGVALSGGRSVAVDSRWLPLGAPIFLSTTQPTGESLQRLVMTQDTGGAIRGALRADLFWGLGAAAGEMAGNMRQQGQLTLIWPIDQPLPERTN